MIVKSQLIDAQLELLDNENPRKKGQPIYDISNDRIKVNVDGGSGVKEVRWIDDKTKLDELVNDDGLTSIGTGLPGQALKRKLDDTGWEFGEVAANVDFVVDQFTGDGTTTVFTLSRDVGNSANADVYFTGVKESVDNYTITGNQLTFTTAPENGIYFEVKMGATGTIAEPADNTVSTQKIQDEAITTAKIQDFSVTNQKINDDFRNKYKIGYNLYTSYTGTTPLKFSEFAVKANKIYKIHLSLRPQTLNGGNVRIEVVYGGTTIISHSYATTSPLSVAPSMTEEFFLETDSTEKNLEFWLKSSDASNLVPVYGAKYIVTEMNNYLSEVTSFV